MAENEHAEKDFVGSQSSWTLRKIMVACIGTVMLVVGAAFMLLVAVLTLFQTRRFYSEGIASRMARVAVWLSGVRIVEHHAEPLPANQTVYISNHTATLDIFVVTALGLPNARYFLSGFLRKVLPFGLIGYLIGVFWTVPYKFADKRRRIFQRAEDTLRKTGDSVYLSPEGGRVCSGEIGHFNRGAFHLATNLQVDIVPIYVHIPLALDAGMNLVSDSGVVDVYFLPRVATAGWKVEELDRNRDAVRQVYLDFHASLQQQQQA
jgi:1-acyl-sn-glycerol-3-phosphate acyltransferase